MHLLLGVDALKLFMEAIGCKALRSVAHVAAQAVYGLFARGARGGWGVVCVCVGGEQIGIVFQCILNFGKG